MTRFSGAIAMLLCLVATTACDSQGSKSEAGHRGTSSLVISQVRADRTAFDPARKESLTIRFHLDEPGDVALAIYDGRDHRVYQGDANHMPAGDHALTWAGVDDGGRPVPAEAYAYTLTARNAHGETTHDLSDLTGGTSVVARDVRWDAAAGVVRYTLDRPSRVNLRLGLQAGPYLRTLIDWVPRQAGPHEEHWDGRDASGVLSLAGNPALTPVVRAYALPDNTVFVGAPTDRLQFVAEHDAPVLRAQGESKGPVQVLDAMRQPLETRGDLMAFLDLDGRFPADGEGRRVVSGMVPFVANVRDADRERVLQRRFEAVFYVDGVFVHENELGYLPLTWVWDASRVNPGEHYVTLNIRGYEGNFGTATRKVIVKPATSSPPVAGTSPEQEQP